MNDPRITSRRLRRKPGRAQMDAGDWGAHGTDPSASAPIRLFPTTSAHGRMRIDRLADDRLEIATPRGLDPLSGLLIEAAMPLEGTSNQATLMLAMDDAFAAIGLDALHPERPRVFHHYDLWRMRQARELARAYGDEQLTFHCSPDLRPAVTVDETGETEVGDALPQEIGLILTIVRKDDEAALTLELLRQAEAALMPGGKLLAASDNARDQWLGRQLERAFGNLTLAARCKQGRVYSVKKTAREAPVAPGYIRNVAVHFGDLALDFESRYGTFSSGGLDEGSRALLEKLEPPQPCRAVLDLGCGWGAMGLIAARLTGAERLTMIDANARAAQMARRNAARLNAAGAAATCAVDVRLEADAESLSALDELGSYDLVISNPPYGTEFRVAERFIQVARLALRLGGRVYLVGKHNERLANRVEEVFGNQEMLHRRGYAIVTAVRKN